MKAESVSPYLLRPLRDEEQARADLIAFARSLDPDRAVFNATTGEWEERDDGNS